MVRGGGNAERIERIPEGARRGDNDNAFRGGFHLWATEAAPLAHVAPTDVWKRIF